MREWTLLSGSPVSLTLATDARLCTPNYCDDHIWELDFGGGEPPAISLLTTYGLRARNMRIFPQFTEGNITISDPREFPSPPKIQCLYPNSLLLSFSPLNKIEVTNQVWVPNSQVIACRILITNQDSDSRHLRFSLVAHLTPGDKGGLMTPRLMQSANVLQGKTDGLVPVIFITGGAQALSSPFPSLNLELELPAGGQQQLTWAQAALSEADASFELARSTTARSWDAERARIQMLNDSQVEISTGNPDWDTAFALGQKVARSLLQGPTEHLPNMSFVSTRIPDMGFSLLGDGSDYPHIWSGQTPLETWYLMGYLLPDSPEIATGLVENFLSTQTREGFVDGKPGLGGQRNQLMAAPLLANIAWRVYETTDDRAWLEQVFPKLLEFFHAWFRPPCDRDGDGIPEWSHPLQFALENHPLFSYWQPWAQGLDISTVESPALCALLYCEGQTLIKMAEAIHRKFPIPAIESLCENLYKAVNTSWDDKVGFRYWDRNTHFSTVENILGELQGPGEVQIHQTFQQATRLLIRINSTSESRREASLFIHGTITRGHHRVERLTYPDLKWYQGMGTATSNQTYDTVEHIQVVGVGPEDITTVQIADLNIRDITLLLPLWAKMVNAKQVKTLIRGNFRARQNKRWCGLPFCPDYPVPEASSICLAVSPMWNALIGEGLLAYGYQQETADLISRLMEAIVKNLKDEAAFRNSYHAETGEGLGERNALGGLPPLDLFLRTLGIRLISPWTVEIRGQNPFPWPIKVSYRGLTVLRDLETTHVTFPDGESVSLTDPSSCSVYGRPSRV
ncbi:MAG: hypothetical protein AB1345_02045 [Chloroflexota bacterium]